MRRCINEGSDELLFDFEGLVQFPRTFCPGLGKMTSVGAYRATVSSERNMYVRTCTWSKEQSGTDENYAFSSRLPMPAVPLKTYLESASMHMLSHPGGSSTAMYITSPQWIRQIVVEICNLSVIPSRP